MFDNAPAEFRGLVDRMVQQKDVARGVDKFKDRASEFRSPEAAMLADIAKDRIVRELFDSELDMMWRQAEFYGDIVYDEIVIGAGLHAAIYASVRAAEGKPMTVVLEASERVGGIFAITESPSFYLNSRNRPGTLGLPGQASALNVIPGGPVQPADLSGDEYQRNSDLAFCIRCALACHAKVNPNRRVEYIELDDDRESDTVRMALEGGTVIFARRVLVATGLGMENNLAPGVNGKIITYTEFLKRLDTDFPLQGVGRAAVIGAGDSGKTAVEALLGQGPQMGYSVAALDYVELIDWYGVPATCLTREGWEANNRSRYKPLARLFPRGDGLGTSRIQPLEERAVSVAVGYESAYVNDRPYDLVIDCTGFKEGVAVQFPDPWVQLDCAKGGRPVAKQFYDEENNQYVPVWTIGPAAKINVSEGERTASDALSNVPENSTALFRYADRTATLAVSFDEQQSDAETDINVREGMINIKDANGKKLSVGDRVKLGNDRKGTVVGLSTSSASASGRPIVSVNLDGGEPVKAYQTVNGTYASYIAYADNLMKIRKSRTKENVLGRDKYDRAIVEGTIVRVVSDNVNGGTVNVNNECPALRVYTRDTGYIVIDTPDRGEYIVRPEDVIVKKDTGATYIEDGESIYSGDLVTYEASIGNVKSRVIGASNNRSYAVLIEDIDGQFESDATDSETGYKGYCVRPTDLIRR